ncbi:MAG: response regulator [Candidatus Latescibacterota bacterium]|mgnify:CR=1 FL=1|jgi:DNA-binding response OmpR family regulator|tara:strand:- start:333 stop:713 length:381 start_codon:yes stop_codon:yes gene_type:complete
MTENKKERVLIVDDDRSSARAIERTLRRAGFETEIAMDGFSAQAMLQSFAPSVMTLDLMMPGLDGHGVLQSMSENKQTSNTGTLVISGMPEENLRSALLQGADDVLSKPYENKTLVEKVMSLARRA